MKVTLRLNAEEIRKALRDAMVAKLGPTTLRVSIYDVKVQKVRRPSRFTFPIEFVTAEVVA